MVRTWLEINKEAFTHNITQIKRVIGSVNLGVVIKSDGYGHGLKTMASLAQAEGQIAYIFVSNTREALDVRSAGCTKPILVMAYYNTPLEEVIAQDIDLVCYSQETFKAARSAAQRVQKIARLHLKVDTGMTRLGIMPDHVNEFVQQIQSDPWTSLVGLMSHCADSTIPDSAFTKKQIVLFDAIAAHVKKKVSTLQWIHCCSSSSFLFSEHHTIVRVGTTLYGCWKSPIQKTLLQECDPNFSLRQLITWKAQILGVKRVPRTSVIGYSCSFIADHDMTIAFVPVGYSEGYPRELSNRGFVQVRGQRADIIGIISMGMLAIDVTHIPEVAVGEEVILLADEFGLRIDDWASKTGRLNLDLLIRLHPLLERVVTGE